MEDADEVRVTVEGAEPPGEGAAPEPAGTPEGRPGPAGRQEGAGEAAGLVEDLQAKLAEVQQRAADLEDRLRHTLADFQNLQRRTASDIERGVGEGVGRLLADLLPIYDDFSRAREAAGGDKAVSDGLGSILRGMDALLTKHGVTPMDAVGEIFDPNLHEAVGFSEDAALDENTVIREIRKGYISHRKVIRPALVEVSRKPKPAPQE